ncbi:MAG: class I SAM-dependent methyltransferase [Chthoniobacteraceae bacterium]
MNPHFVTRTQCPACGSTSGRTLYDRLFTESPIRDYLVSFYEPQGGVEFACLEDASFTLLECEVCGLIYQKFIANDALMERLYDRWIDPAKVFALIDGCQPPGYFMDLAKQVANLVDFFGRPAREISCLDFGMGWGHWCKMARTFGCEVAGVELSSARIEHAQRSGLTVLRPEEVVRQRFDFINTEQVFEHIPEPFETLVSLKQSLKPDGLIRLSVPDGWGIKVRLARGDWRAGKGSAESLNAVAPLEHINCFHHHNLVRLADRAGFRVVTMLARHAVSFVDAARDLIKPLYYGLRRRGSAAIYATPRIG